MATFQAFIDAIIADPEADDIRLIFADWLQEQRDAGLNARGEFIRVQIEIAELDRELMSDEDCDHLYCPGCVERRELRRRERELLSTLPVPDICWAMQPRFVGESASCKYVRGFIEEITCASAFWLGHADAICCETPLREVTLTTWPGGDFELSFNASGMAETLPGTQRMAYRLGSYRGYLPDDFVFDTVRPWEQNVSGPILHTEWPCLTFTLPDGSRVEAATCIGRA